MHRRHIPGTEGEKTEFKDPLDHKGWWKLQLRFQILQLGEVYNQLGVADGGASRIDSQQSLCKVLLRVARRVRA